MLIMCWVESPRDMLVWLGGILSQHRPGYLGREEAEGEVIEWRFIQNAVRVLAPCLPQSCGELGIYISLYLCE